jgi:hypothetical protein
VPGGEERLDAAAGAQVEREANGPPDRQRGQRARGLAEEDVPGRHRQRRISLIVRQEQIGPRRQLDTGGELVAARLEEARVDKGVEVGRRKRGRCLRSTNRVLEPE